MHIFSFTFPCEAPHPSKVKAFGLFTRESIYFASNYEISPCIIIFFWALIMQTVAIADCDGKLCCICIVRCVSRSD